MSVHAQGVAAAGSQGARRPAARRTLRVHVCEEVLRFQGKDGRPGVLYSVRAEDPAGRRIAQELRSFEELPVGEMREYEVSPYQKPGRPVSYTLRIPRPSIAELAAELRAFNRDITNHAELLEQHTRALVEHARRLQGLEQRVTLAEQGGPLELPDEVDHTADEEIPF